MRPDAGRVAERPCQHDRAGRVVRGRVAGGRMGPLGLAERQVKLDDEYLQAVGWCQKAAKSGHEVGKRETVKALQRLGY